MAHIHTPAELALIGRRVRYCGDMANPSGSCVIYAVTPHTRTGQHYRLSASGLNERLPAESVKVDLVFEDGRTWRGWGSEDFTVPGGAPHNGFHRLLLLDEFIDSDALSAMLANAASVKATKQAKKDEAAAVFAAECERLKAAHPYLTPSEHPNTTAANMRALLKREFPGVKFSVRRDGWNCINVRWTDGPTDDAASALAQRFKSGDFDGMTDCYEYRRTPWGETFGSVQYVFTRREKSDELILRAIEEVAQERGENNRTTLEDYLAGRSAEHVRRWIWEQCEKIDLTPAEPASKACKTEASIEQERPQDPPEEAEALSLDDLKERAAPELITHTTKRGKVLTGIIRTDLTREQAEQIDHYTFKKAGGWFIRARHLDNGSASQ